MQEKAFDSYASVYDMDFSDTAIGRLQRTRVWKFLDKKLNQPLKVLELNCGTGEDAQYFVEKGHTVLASDISAKMISIARKKVASSRVVFKVCSIQDIRSLENDGPYDLIFSNFGGLNCLNPIEVQTLISDLYRLTAHNGRLMLVIMGRKCLWESAYFKWKGDTAKSNRRLLKDGTSVSILGSDFLCHYYSPSEIARIATPYFTDKKIKPIGIFIPPSYLNPFFEKRKGLLHLLTLAENTIGNLSFLGNYADHFLISLKRKNET